MQTGINQANKRNGSFAACAHGRRICLLQFAIVLKLKNSKGFQRRSATASNNSTLRMWRNQPN